MPRISSLVALTSAIVVVLVPFVVEAQTAASFPPLVYTYQPGTGSVNPSLLTAAGTAAAPYSSALNSQGSDTATRQVAPFPTTTTQGPTGPVPVTTTFAFSSASPGVVLSSNTRPLYTASGSFIASTITPIMSTRAPSNGAGSVLRDGKGIVGMAVGVVVGVAVGGSFLL